MACHSVLVAIITAYLSAIAYGTPIDTPPNNSLVIFQNEESITPESIDPSDPPTTSFTVSTLTLNFSSQLPTRTNSPEDELTADEDKLTSVNDTANINDAQTSTERNAKNSTISTSSTSISTSSLISTTTSTGTTLPPENHELNFTAVWQTDEDSLDYIMVLWSEESNVNATRPVNWKLLVSRESENESLIIRSSCSWHNNSRHHQVKLEKESLIDYRVSCNDNSRHEDLVFKIRSCLSYDLLLFAHPGKDHPIGRTKLKPLIKWPSKIESSYNAIDKKIVIHWESPYKNMTCSLKYRYNLFVDRVGNVSETTEDSRIEHPAELCTNYSISVWSIVIDGSHETISDQPIRHANRTENQDLDMTAMAVNAQAINKTCLIVSWSQNDNYCYIVGCASLRILLEPPSEEEQDSSILTNDKQKEKMICHLRPGTQYNVRVEFTDYQGTRKYSPYASGSTPSEYDTVTVGLIVLSCILVLLLLGVSLYCVLPWFTRNRRRSNGDNQSVRLKSSFFGNMGRRRSHPIKLRNLNAVTQRLCSSAGHLLEMEFEDLVIIADARRPKDSPIALLQENTIKNRYVNILPYEHNCVSLSLLPDSTNSNYINASYIMGFNDPREYIATQGPKICTIEDFWRMVWEQNVHIIIMVTSLEERGKPKCDRYWPEDAANPLTFESLSVSQLNETDFESYTLRSFKVERNGKSRTVKQAYLKGWPDFGVPNNPEILIRFIEVVRVLVNETSTSQISGSLQPIVVHCSAGVGRTGTFIAVDWLMQEARVEKEIDIFSTILRMRECRLNMVQSEEQYEYIYRCMSHFVNTRLFATVEQSCDAATFLTNGNNPLLNELE
ncbi:uncharacterized protein LOC124188395 isoform X2 [Daphnia pulex]|uniref:uncharacterized protein LOC124188395 isoform X2 n=1 Tax=Daphnia pulex TaxID=6669 RepID=UPI001EE02C66|nr:uncharacterized protein LOC124188395 isoform X2 [Daphnia pulex]